MFVLGHPLPLHRDPPLLPNLASSLQKHVLVLSSRLFRIYYFLNLFKHTHQPPDTLSHITAPKAHLEIMPKTHLLDSINCDLLAVTINFKVPAAALDTSRNPLGPHEQPFILPLRPGYLSCA